MIGFVNTDIYFLDVDANPKTIAHLRDQGLRPSRSRWRWIPVGDEMGTSGYYDHRPCT